MKALANGDILKQKLEGLLRSSLSESDSIFTSSKLPSIDLVNGKQTCLINGEKLDFIHDARLQQRLRSGRRFGPHFRYAISCSPELFSKLIEWINERPPPLRYQLAHYSNQFWIDHAVTAWFLAAFQLQAPEFERYALSQFIQNCSLCIFGPWQTIENDAPPGSSLRKFADHWVAWNYYLSGRGQNEYCTLRASGLAAFVTRDTKDPRIYDLEHWFSPCSASPNPDLTCTHDPMWRAANPKRKAENEEKEIDWDEWSRQTEMTLKERGLT